MRLTANMRRWSIWSRKLLRIVVVAARLSFEPLMYGQSVPEDFSFTVTVKDETGNAVSELNCLSTKTMKSWLA